jgi:hypothetical protein
MSFDDIYPEKQIKKPRMKINLITKGCYNCGSSVEADLANDEYWCYRNAQIQSGKMWCDKWRKKK